MNVKVCPEKVAFYKELRVKHKYMLDLARNMEIPVKLGQFYERYMALYAQESTDAWNRATADERAKMKVHQEVYRYLDKTISEAAFGAIDADTALQLARLLDGHIIPELQVGSYVIRDAATFLFLWDAMHGLKEPPFSLEAVFYQGKNTKKTFA